MNAISESESRAEGGFFGFARLDAFRLAVPAEVAEEVISGPIELSALPSGSRYLMGVFSLRGLPVPVLDLRVVLGERDGTERPGSIANAFLVKWGDLRFAVEISEIGGVAHCEADSLTRVDDERYSGVFRTLHTDQKSGVVSSVLDVEALLSLEGMRAALSNRRSSDVNRRRRTISRGGSVVFEAGGFRFAVDCFALRWVEPMAEALETPFSSSVLLGFQEQRNGEGHLAVLDVLGLCGLATEEMGRNRRSLIVLQWEGRELGLAVDTVVEIRSFEQLEQHPVEARSLGGVDIFLGSVVDEEGREVFLIDPEKLGREGEALGAYSQLAASNVSKTLERQMKGAEHFIVFRVGAGYFAAMLKGLDAVIDVPASMIELAASGEGVRGMCSHLGRPVRVFELRASLPSKREGKLVLMREGSGYLALRVDRVACLQWGVPEVLPRGGRSEAEDGFSATQMLSLEKSGIRASATVVPFAVLRERAKG